jgi:hypothetical protein
VKDAPEVDDMALQLAFATALLLAVLLVWWLIAVSRAARRAARWAFAIAVHQSAPDDREVGDETQIGARDDRRQPRPAAGANESNGCRRLASLPSRSADAAGAREEASAAPTAGTIRGPRFAARWS